MNTALGRILLVTDALFLLSGGLLAPIYALFVEKIGGDLLDASIAYSLFMLSAGLVVAILAFWEDKSKNQKKFVIVGYGLGTLGSIGYLLVNSTPVLFMVQIIMGLSVALKDPAYDALFSQTAKKHLALFWGEWEAMDYFTYGLGAFLGGIIAQYFGFTTLIWYMIGLSLSSFCVSLLLLRVKKS